jgi:hypothetical protein
MAACSSCNLTLSGFITSCLHRISSHQGWIEVEADDIGHLLGKPWIARALEGAQPVWLELVGIPGAAAPSAARCRQPLLREVSREWKMPPREWAAAKTQFAVMFGERFTADKSTFRPSGIIGSSETGLICDS